MSAGMGEKQPRHGEKEASGRRVVTAPSSAPPARVPSFQQRSVALCEEQVVGVVSAGKRRDEKCPPAAVVEAAVLERPRRAALCRLSMSVARLPGRRSAALVRHRVDSQMRDIVPTRYVKSASAAVARCLQASRTRNGI